MCHIISSRVEYSEQVGFDSDGSTFIADNSSNAQILSEEDMFIDEIDLIISNVLASIGGKYLIPKGIGNLSGPGLMTRDN